MVLAFHFPSEEGGASPDMGPRDERCPPRVFSKRRLVFLHGAACLATVSGTSEFIHLGHHAVAGDPKEASQACLWGKFQIQGHGLG